MSKLPIIVSQGYTRYVLLIRKVRTSLRVAFAIGGNYWVDLELSNVEKVNNLAKYRSYHVLFKEMRK